MALIINGDDFGLSESCSKAIAEAMRKGFITSTTMMATGEYFDEAVRLAREYGFVDKIGVHLNLTEGRPLTKEMENTLAFVRNGLFHKDYLKTPRELTGQEKEAVFAELCAQVERIKSAGIPITRADSHHYIHNLIHIAPLVSMICKRYDIKRIRISRTFDTDTHPERIENSWWSEQGFETTAHFGRMSDYHTYGFPDDTEIMVHPDYDKNGVLIDRTGVQNDYPTGKKLEKIL